MIINILLSSLMCFSQSTMHEAEAVEGQGSLVNLRLEIGKKSAKLFLVGKEAAKINFSGDAKILNITAFDNNGKKEELKFVPGQGYYIVDALPEWDQPYTLKVKTRVSKGEDEVSLKVKPKP